MALVKRAIAMNPAHPGWYEIPLVLDAYRRRAWDEALANVDLMAMPRYYRTWVFAAMIAGQKGDKALGDTALRRLAELDPDFGINAEAEIRKWGLQPDMAALCLDGLKKAGLAANGT